MFNAWFPLLEVVLYWGIRFVYRALDRNCRCTDTVYKNDEWIPDDKKVGDIKKLLYVTKSKTLNQYLETYLGGVYAMHFKYSGIMNICFVTLMYGFGMPILYPIAVYALVVLYLSEKALLYYSYRQPPSYDQRLSNTVIRMMMSGPVLMLSFGYWMVSSK